VESRKLKHLIDLRLARREVPTPHYRMTGIAWSPRHGKISKVYKQSNARRCLSPPLEISLTPQPTALALASLLIGLLWSYRAVTREEYSDFVLAAVFAAGRPRIRAKVTLCRIRLPISKLNAPKISFTILSARFLPSLSFREHHGISWQSVACHDSGIPNHENPC
jgi:hypothetical protein